MRDYERLQKIASHLSELIDYGSFRSEELDALQKELKTLSNKLVVDDQPTKKDYIIYECQALICWLKGNDTDAHDFARIASDMRGDELETENGRLLAGRQHDKLNGVRGWLMLFSVGIVLSVLSSTANMFLSLSGYSSLEQYGYSWWIVLGVIEVVGLVVLAVMYFYFLAERSKHAKDIAIGYIALCLIISAFDAIIMSQLNQTIGATGSPISDSYLSRNILAAIIWIPYFMNSKRVKHTLIN